MLCWFSLLHVWKVIIQQYFQDLTFGMPSGVVKTAYGRWYSPKYFISLTPFPLKELSLKETNFTTSVVCCHEKESQRNILYIEIQFFYLCSVAPSWYNSNMTNKCGLQSPESIFLNFLPLFLFILFCITQNSIFEICTSFMFGDYSSNW